MYKAALAFLCAASVLAPLGAQAGEVRNREIRQEHRIYAGVKNGTLSPNEYARLQRQEFRLNEQRSDHVRYGRLNREENHLSREIYRDKHDGPGH